jgi:predicted ATPase
VRADPDLLFAAKSLLIETHSEHIMLRLLRRIRETSEGLLPPATSGLRPDDLSVVYVESNQEGVHFRKLRIDQTGEFVDRWPHGFFEQRAEELF